MGKLIFSSLWTLGACGVIYAMFRNEQSIPPEPGLLLIALFPLFGLLAIVLSLLEMRRRRSLHQVTENGVVFWVWIGFDGRLHRSEEDPTTCWDSGDGDGDGGGGD